MMEETPGKVLGLLAAAFGSMLMLFLVSYSNVSFSSSEMPIPDPFGRAKVVSMLDNVSASYSKFLATNLINPAKGDYAFVSDNVSWVWQESEPSIAKGLGLSPMPPAHGQVAGAFISAKAAPLYETSSGGFSIDTIYSILIR